MKKFLKLMFLVVSVVSFTENYLFGEMAFGDFSQKFFASREQFRFPLSPEQRVIPELYPDQFVAADDFSKSIQFCKNLLGVFIQGGVSADNLYGRGCKDSNVSYIQKFVVNPGNKIIVIGDLHGSGHALIKNLQNINIGDDFKLCEDVNILIFTGDLIHRGRYGIENIYLVTRLMAANPGRVFWVRGNHETRHVVLAKNYGLKAEFDKKYPQDKDIFEETLKLFDILPCALFMGYGDSYVQVCHSGIPADVKEIERVIEGGYFQTEYDVSPSSHNGLIENLIKTSNSLECMSIPGDLIKGYLYNGFSATETCRDLKMQQAHRINISMIQNILPQNVRAIIRGHTHNSKAVSAVTSKNLFDKVPAGVFPLKNYLIYTFMSCPEGLGGCDPELSYVDEENCHIRGYGVITVGKSWDEWTMEQFEFNESD